MSGYSECVVCGQYIWLRHIERIGDICKTCFINAPSCIVEGCNDPSVKHGRGKCREHYMDIDPPSNDIGNYGGLRNSSLTQCSDETYNRCARGRGGVWRQ